MRKIYLLSLVLSIIMSVNVFAQDFGTIPFQGSIANGTGTPYTGSFDFNFEIYNTIGTSLWTSGIVNLPVNIGAYAVELGKNPLNAIPDTIWKTSDSLFLEISFNDGVNGLETLNPRIKFLPVPYAVFSKYADEFCGDSLHTSYIYSVHARFDTITNKVFFKDTVEIKKNLILCGDLIMKGGIIDSTETLKLVKNDVGFKVDDISTPGDEVLELENAIVRLKCPNGTTTLEKNSSGGSIKSVDDASGKEVEIQQDAINELIKMITGELIILPDPASNEKAILEEDKLKLENTATEFLKQLDALGGKTIAKDVASGQEVESLMDAVNEIIKLTTGNGIVILPNPTSDEKANLDEEKLRFENLASEFEQELDGAIGKITARDVLSGEEVQTLLDAVNDVVKHIAKEVEHSNNGNMAVVEEIDDNGNVVVRSIIDGVTDVILEISDPSNKSQTTEGVLEQIQIAPAPSQLAFIQALNPGNGTAELIAINGPNNVGFELNPSTSTSTHFGNLDIMGNISKLGGTFKIDHPLDPLNKYLVHSFVESPDMMNIYNGNATTDGSGYVTVILPDYFEALNMEFRYQLTTIGTFAQAIVKEEVNGNKFVIQTDSPNVKVSWQVTGVRQDTYAKENRVVVEVDKEDGRKGNLLYPSNK